MILDSKDNRSIQELFFFWNRLLSSSGSKTIEEDFETGAYIDYIQNNFPSRENFKESIILLTTALEKYDWVYLKLSEGNFTDYLADIIKGETTSYKFLLTNYLCSYILRSTDETIINIYSKNINMSLFSMYELGQAPIKAKLLQVFIRLCKIPTIYEQIHNEIESSDILSDPDFENATEYEDDDETVTIGKTLLIELNTYFINDDDELRVLRKEEICMCKEIYIPDYIENQVFKYITEVSQIAACALFGSVKCFKYLMMNGEVITDGVHRFAIAGGKNEIVHICEQNGLRF